MIGAAHGSPDPRMTLPLGPADITLSVLWAGALIGIALGVVAQSTRFCTMGALADWFTFGSSARLMMWVLAVAVAATGSMLLISNGWLDATRALPWSERFLWLSYAVGGMLFGAGMVLASGCPQRSLVKAGAGNLKAWFTLLVVGVTAQMSLRGVLAPPRVNGLDAAGVQLAHPQDIGSMLAPALGAPAATLRWITLLVLLLAAALLLWRARAGMDRSHWLGGLGVGLLVPCAWAATGHLGFLAEHPETLEAAWLGTASRRPEALTFTAPLAYSLDLLTLWTDRNTTLSFGVAVALGVVAGSAASALWRREFRVESFRSTDDLLTHTLGGVLMGFGGVTAVGCSIGQGISGVSLLSAGSFIALAGIVLGTWLALRVQAWRLDRAAA